MMVHPMYKFCDRLDLAGDLLDTNHPLEDTVIEGRLCIFGTQWVRFWYNICRF